MQQKDTSTFLKSFFSTQPAPCPYLKDKMEVKLAVDICGSRSQQWLNVLSRSGFRRSHSVCYIPACSDCQACISVRLSVADFSLAKKMSKTLRQNKNLDISLIPNIATAEQYSLFSAYLERRHTESEMNSMFFEEYRAMIEDAPVNSCLMEVRDSQSGLLQGLMLIDVMDDGASAVYSFFNPELEKKSIGTFMILKLIEAVASQKLPYVYLGYMIKELPNMAYKMRFQPLEYYHNGQWMENLPSE